MHKGKIVVPDGGVVHGRIRAVDHFPDRGVYAIGLEFTDVEVGGESLPFYADLERLDKNPRIELQATRQVFVRDRTGIRPREETLTLPALPGVASFFVRGSDFTLPTGFRMIWRTRGLLRGE